MNRLADAMADLRAAFAFLTILPVGYPPGRKPGYAYSWFPLVGLVIGLAIGLVGSLPLPSPAIRGFCLLLTWVMLSGGLHLDGFGDACDGLLATANPEKRLEIMKDPRAGSWAVVGLILLLLGKWVLLQTLPVGAWVATPVVARWAMVLAVSRFPYARTGGLGGYFRAGFGPAQEHFATLLTLLIIGAVAWLADVRVLLILLIPLVTVWVFGRWAAGRLGGGLTGDVYGAICELSELVGLFMLTLASPSSPLS